MTEFLINLIPWFKALHVFALALWCGGLLAMPLMMARQDRSVSPEDYRRIRLASHLMYTLGVTPAGVITVISGTWLIFMRETFHPWFYGKLLFVTGLVAAHVWIGTMLVAASDTSRDTDPPSPVLPVAAVLLSVLCVLTLVLTKPDFGVLQLPSWLSEPLGRELLFAVPRL